MEPSKKRHLLLIPEKLCQDPLGLYTRGGEVDLGEEKLERSRHNHKNNLPGTNIKNTTISLSE